MRPRPFNGAFDDATFAVENAIIGQGLVVDWVSHVGDMPNRTDVDVQLLLTARKGATQ